MILNRFLMLISILKFILLKMTTVWLWFLRKVQRQITTKQFFHTVTQSKFDELVRNFDKNVIWNELYTFPFKTQNWYFLLEQLQVTFSQKEISDFVYVFSDRSTHLNKIGKCCYYMHLQSSPVSPRWSPVCAAQNWFPHDAPTTSIDSASSTPTLVRRKSKDRVRANFVI